MNHISIDIETFDSNPGAALASVGVAAVGEEVLLSKDVPEKLHPRTFYVVLNDHEGSYNPNTIRWHINQANPRRNLGAKGKPLKQGLATLRTFLRDLNADKEGEACIWSHATFDMPQLHMAFDRAGLGRPWHYRNCRDLRTLYWMAGGRPIVHNTHKHHALADAKAQLEEVRDCLHRLEARGLKV